MIEKISVFAPATVANVAVGFDLLGFPIEHVGDILTVERIQRNSTPESSVVIQEIAGNDPGTQFQIPLDPLKNTATVGLVSFLRDLQLDFGLRVSIRKGIPLGSGMGGSAASAVGAVVAANHLLKEPLPKTKLLKYALIGEALASGSVHADNVAPCLFGGLTLVQSHEPADIVNLPVPPDLFCVLVHPHARLDTRESRRILKRDILLEAHIQQSALLAGFITGCFQNDLNRIQMSLKDILIEPQRAPLIRGFEPAQSAALQAGALGCSISGAGPSVFAWARSKSEADHIQYRMLIAFEKSGVKADSWISPISKQGAKVI
jgi:homoserine kinase